MAISPFFLFLLLLVVSVLVVVFVFRYDLRFDRIIDEEYYSNFPFLNKIISSLKLLPRYIVLSCSLAFLALTLWNWLADRFGWNILTNLSQADWKAWKFTRVDGYWQMACAVLGLLAVIDLLRCLRRPVGYNFQRITPSMRRTRSQGMGASPAIEEDSVPSFNDDHWDVFISYKSQDVDIARRVANLLLGSGLKVWFAENKVLLENYDQFQQAIDYGIAHSDYGIAFTNDTYAGSEYCRLEMKQLLEHLPASKLLEVMVPRKQDRTHRDFQSLDRCPATIGGDLPGILDFIRSHITLKVASSEPDYIATIPQLHRSLCLGRTVTLDARDWEIHERGDHPGGTTSGEMLTHKHRQDQYRMFMNLECGEEWSLPGQRQDQSADDRQMYNFLRQYAVSHLGKLGANIYGLHLFFKGGLSQFGMTYRMERYWTRKISVIIPNKITGKMAEFVFTFGFNGSFPQYCLNAHIMDQMVASLQWL